jgi:DnaJ-class molecular chaperone
MYNQFGHAGPQGPAGAPGGRTYTWTSGGAPVDFEEIFGGGSSGFGGMGLDEILEALSGGHRGPSRRAAPPRRGSDAEYDLALDFMEAIRGTTATLRIRAPDSKTGETINVKIPPGVREGSRIRVRGKGQPGPAGRGDLYIVTHVRDHPYFRREGDDIYVDLPVSIAEAALGATIDVPTIDGMTRVKVPPGTSSSVHLRLKRKGAPCRTGGGGKDSRGDQYVVIRIVAPSTLSPQGRELLRKLQDTEKLDPRESVPWK